MQLETIKRRVVIDAPLEAVLSLTLDVARYPEFAPSIEKTELVSHDPQRRTYRVRYTSVIPIIRKRTTSEQEIQYDLAKPIFCFREASGNFGSFEGYRRLEELGDGKTVLESEVRYTFTANKLLAGMVNAATRTIVEDNLVHLQDGIKRVAESGNVAPLSQVFARLGISNDMLRHQGLSEDLLLRFGLLPAA
ncbi:MAG: SRPBCC family protein [Turneriella sp.]|nr:SRPBCC family protein [Turneriella sp.]